MIYNIKEFEKKLIDKDLNRKMLAEIIGIDPNTLTQKVNEEKRDFKISEAVAIAEALELSNEEFMLLFFNKKLSFNESIGKGDIHVN